MTNECFKKICENFITGSVLARYTEIDNSGENNFDLECQCYLKQIQDASVLQVNNFIVKIWGNDDKGIEAKPGNNGVISTWTYEKFDGTNPGASEGSSTGGRYFYNKKHRMMQNLTWSE